MPLIPEYLSTSPSRSTSLGDKLCGYCTSTNDSSAFKPGQLGRFFPTDAFCGFQVTRTLFHNPSIDEGT